MLHDYENKSLHDRFKYLLKVLSSERFRTLQGIGNEVPFFICPFSANETLEMIPVIRDLETQLHQKGIKVERVNIYDLCVKILKERPRVWDVLQKREKEMPKEELLEQMQAMLDPQDYLVPRILEHLSFRAYDILFLDGVGEVYPYVRTHTLLENLETSLSRTPLVLFFPGVYVQNLHTGAALRLFGKHQDDKYYRAFNIYSYDSNES